MEVFIHFYTNFFEVSIKISLDGGPLPKWSNLTFLDGSLTYQYVDYTQNNSLQFNNKQYHYMFFVTMIREFFKSASNPYFGLTPFKAEFYICPEQQWEMAAKNLLEQNLLSKLSSNTGVSVNNPGIKQLCIDLNKALYNHNYYLASNAHILHTIL